MNQSIVLSAAKAFFHQLDSSITEESIKTLSGGLINHTYKVTPLSGQSILLQRFNTDVFKNPAGIQSNYRKIHDFTVQHHVDMKLPVPLQNVNGSLLFVDEEGGYWRAFEFIGNSVSFLTALLPAQAYTTAKTFGKFSASLKEFDATGLETTIPDFHNLDFRYQQFLDALNKAGSERKEIAQQWIKALLDRSHYKEFYNLMCSNPEHFKIRVMHHDAKIANMLFDVNSNEVVCVVDFDTTMPGYYFSDLGDMIRSMACSHDENYVAFDELSIREDFYKSLVKGYLEEMEAVLTEEEKKQIDQCGLLMYYMQAIRFLADYLNNDIYYRIQYPEQNLHRAINQVTLLIQLETLLQNTPAVS